MPYDGTNYGGTGSNSSSWADYQKQLNNQGSMGGNTGRDVLRGFIGGPVGWGEIAGGQSALTGLFGMDDPLGGMGTSLSKDMSEDVYNSMSDGEWNHFRSLGTGAQQAFIQQRQREIRDPNSQYNLQQADRKKQSDAEAALKVKADARGAAQDDLVKKVQAFADEMNMPVSELMQKDDFAQALNKVTYQNSVGKSLNTGAAGGGLSTANADQATKNALLGYQFQRQQVGNQARNEAFGMLSNQNAAAEDISRYNQGMNLQMQSLQAQSQAQQYQQNLSRSGQTLGMIGGVIGGIYGGAAGAGAGYNLGSGLGQSQYQSSNPYKPYQYSYPSSSRGGGGGSGYGGLGSY